MKEDFLITPNAINSYISDSASWNRPGYSPISIFKRMNCQKAQMRDGRINEKIIVVWFIYPT